MRELVCLLRLHKEDLEEINLKNYQRLLWEKFSEGNYTGTLIFIRSNFGKEFVFYIPY
jgi:hypothetical protein